MAASRRSALLASASVAVLGFGSFLMPASAAAQTSVPGPVVGQAGPSVTDLLVLSPANGSAGSGTSDSGDASATAVVDTVASGRVEQVGTATGNAPDGDVTIDLSNLGQFQLQASAEGTGSGVAAFATGEIRGGIVQEGIGQDRVLVWATNAGQLELLATGAAASDTAPADAGALIERGIAQTGRSDAAATVMLMNNGELDLGTLATAASPVDSNASVTIGDGIVQTVSGADTVAVIANAEGATLTVGSHASALGAGISVSNIITNAIRQSGNAPFTEIETYTATTVVVVPQGQVGLTLSNSGTLDIRATSEGSGTGSGTVASTIASGIRQEGFGVGHSALIVANAGSLTLAAGGTGTLQPDSVAGLFDLDVRAQHGSGINQALTVASNGSAATILQNSGTLLQQAVAEANGNVADGAPGTYTVRAGSDNSELIQQRAGAHNGAASAEIANSGSLTALGEATASARDDADAAADGDNLIFQRVAATNGTASSIITNALGATIGMSLTATAATTGTAAQRADAEADAASMLYQQAEATNGAATAALTNSGAITFGASGQATSSSGEADSRASLSALVSQSAQATDGGSADLTFTNDGTFEGNGTSLAHAQGAGGTANADLVNSDLLVQEASSDGGDAAATFTNSGTLEVNGIALATALSLSDEPALTASASYGADTVIRQQVSGGAEGSATATFTNSDRLALTGGAQATADGSASAEATAGRVIRQVVSLPAAGSGAQAVVGNSGTIAIDLSSVADGGEGAMAASALVDGIDQLVDFENMVDPSGESSVSLANAAEGTIDIAISAAASGGLLTGNASAYGARLIDQNVFISSAGNLAELTNLGEVRFTASAEARTLGLTEASSAIARLGNNEQEDDHVIGQRVFNLLGSTARLVNGGTILLGAEGAVEGGLGASASLVQVALLQDAQAFSGAASAELDNQGTVELTSSAEVTTEGSLADALARVEGGLVQQAISVEGAATAAINNDGTLGFRADAMAAAGMQTESSGQAFALVSSAALQYAESANAEARATFVNTGAVSVESSAGASGSVLAQSTAISQNVIEQQGATGDGSAIVRLVNTGDISIGADASAGGALVDASSTAIVGSGIRQQGTRLGTGSTLVALENGAGGAIRFRVGARTTEAAGAATATGIAERLIAQIDAGTMTFVNAGLVQTELDLAAAAGGLARVSAILGDGIVQSQSSAGFNSAAFGNTGTIRFTLGGSAEGNGAFADAEIFDLVEQNMDADIAGEAIFVNGGTIALDARLSATNGTGDGASGRILATDLISQDVESGDGEGRASFVNGSGAELRAVLAMTADANGQGNAQANIEATSLILQDLEAEGGDLVASITNNGVIDIAVNATAVLSDSGSADATLRDGVDQNLETESGNADIRFLNNGVINFAALATAGSPQVPGGGSARSYVRGFEQDIDDGVEERMSFTNSGQINVRARSVNWASSNSEDDATAVGLWQTSDGGAVTLTFANSGSFGVRAEVDASLGGGTSEATGVLFDAEDILLDWSNVAGGTITVAATRDSGGAAIATGIRNETDEFTPVTIGGTLSNAGTIAVSAVSNGTTVIGRSAAAVGIDLTTRENELTITNSGSLLVDALVSSGEEVEAVGIRLTEQEVSATTTTVGPTGTQVGSLSIPGQTTIVNSGVIRVRESSDNGATWQRGTAIDTRLAMLPVVIELRGGSDIYGNIAIDGDDSITVMNGETRLDGIVNADGARLGSLTVASGGTLFLTDPRGSTNTAYDGPAAVNVSTFTVASGGVLAVNLPGSVDRAEAEASYPRISAGTVNLTGATLELRPVPGPNAFYADSYTFDNLIDADVRNGQFSACRIVGGGPLLGLTCAYDAANNVDLTFTRTAFDALSGLTENQQAAGSGIEAVYGPNLAAPLVPVVQALFGLDARAYAQALEQLGGSEYASTLQSFGTLGTRVNGMVNRGIDCASAGRPLGWRACRGAYSVWGQAAISEGSKDGKAEAGPVASSGWLGMVGVDAAIGEVGAVGFSAGTLNHDLSFSRTGARFDLDGTSIGAHALVDSGAFYLRGMLTYTDLEGGSQRRLSFGAISGGVSGDVDGRIWALGGEAGARIAAGASTFMPFVRADRVSATLEGVGEVGTPGVRLAVDDSSERWTYGTAGARWAAQFGSIRPELSAAYRHQFGPKVASVDAAFADAPGSDFTVRSAPNARGSWLLGASVGSKIGPASLRIGYERMQSEKSRSDTGSIRLVLPLGAKHKR